MRRLIFTLVIATSACAQSPGAAVGRQAADPQAAGLWGPKPPIGPGLLGGPIRVGLDTPFLKDPSFVADGAPLAGARWIAFGDLRRFWLKAFDLGGEGGPLVFRPGELQLTITGLPPAIDSPWAPQLVRIGERVLLLYCAGEMPAPEPPRWPTFRLRLAETSLASFEAALRGGRGPAFADRGPISTDIAPYGAGDADFGVIDPHFWVNDRGRAYLSYTVVRAGAAGKRAHEELVRYRRVDPIDPARALGPDQPFVDGRPGGDADGVAEAQEVVSFGRRTFLFVSIRAGDVDQRLMVAEVGRDLGYVKVDDLKPFRYPGAEPWMARAVGSSGAATIAGTTYLVHQGLSAERRFSLGWTTVVTR